MDTTVYAWPTHPFLSPLVEPCKLVTSHFTNQRLLLPFGAESHTQLELRKAMEKWSRRGILLAVVAVALVAAMLPSGEAKLSPDHYRSTCPDVEAIVRTAVAKKVNETFVTVPATLRLFFHDCFVEVSNIPPLAVVCSCAFLRPEAGSPDRNQGSI